MWYAKPLSPRPVAAVSRIRPCHYQSCQIMFEVCVCVCVRWVAGTPNSAFKNPEYRLDWGNRITKPAAVLKGGLPTAMLAAATSVQGEPFRNTGWTLQDEKRALIEVDKYTAKMRKRLFAKMAKDGAILLKKGQAKATTGLGAAELDIMKYPGERPDHLRIEQQMLFRKEWKKLTTPQRTAILAGAVASNNAVSPDMMCKTCIRVRSPGHHKRSPGWYHVDGRHRILARRRCLDLEPAGAQGRVYQEVSSLKAGNAGDMQMLAGLLTGR